MDIYEVNDLNNMILRMKDIKMNKDLDLEDYNSVGEVISYLESQIRLKEVVVDTRDIKDFIGKIVRHFKGDYYLVLGVSYYSESKKEEKLVNYKALYGDCRSYSRPIEMFLSKVDKVKYPNVSQDNRFELVYKPSVKDILREEVSSVK